MVEADAIVPYEAPEHEDALPDHDGNVYGARGSFLAKYSSRLRRVNTFQGAVPLSPGETFKLKVVEVGSFGEIAIGLSSTRGQASVDSYAEVDMVGWSRGEVGFQGDHGRCYVNGQEAKRRSGTAWSVGDEIECGLTVSANVYFKHGRQDGTALLEIPGRWQISSAYPTVTMRSSGAIVEIDLGGIEQKPLKDLLPHSGPEWNKSSEALQPRSAPSALNLLTSFKRTVIEEEQCQEGVGVGYLERFFGQHALQFSCCESIEEHISISQRHFACTSQMSTVLYL